MTTCATRSTILLALVCGALGVAAPRCLAQSADAAALTIPPIRDFLAVGGFGNRHPRAPAELEQFGRLAGIWECTQEMRRQDGSWATVGTALWVWRYALGGFAIQDLWYQSEDSLPSYLGDLGHDYLLSGLRTYDVRTGKWKIAWTANGMGQTPGDDFGLLEAEWDGARMVLTSPPGEYGLQRVTFHDIEPNSFTWVSEFSRDGGATWMAVMRVSARRPASPGGDQ